MLSEKVCTVHKMNICVHQNFKTMEIDWRMCNRFFSNILDEIDFLLSWFSWNVGFLSYLSLPCLHRHLRIVRMCISETLTNSFSLVPLQQLNLLVEISKIDTIIIIGRDIVHDNDVEVELLLSLIRYCFVVFFNVLVETFDIVLTQFPSTTPTAPNWCVSIK